MLIKIFKFKKTMKKRIALLVLAGLLFSCKEVKKDEKADNQLVDINLDYINYSYHMHFKYYLYQYLFAQG